MTDVVDMCDTNCPLPDKDALEEEFVEINDCKEPFPSIDAEVMDCVDMLDVPLTSVPAPEMDALVDDDVEIDDVSCPIPSIDAEGDELVLM